MSTTTALPSRVAPGAVRVREDRRNGQHARSGMDSTETERERRRLRAFLDATAYSQAQIAREADVSLGSVSNMYRSGRVGPDVTTKVSGALDRLEQLQPIGGAAGLERLQRLEARMAEISELMDELRKELGHLS